jgi:hypothetical protein
MQALENKALGLNEDGTDPMKSGRAIKMLRAQGIKVYIYIYACHVSYWPRGALTLLYKH